jgi:hypothetical protein
MLDLTDIQTRLRAHCPSLKLVAGSAQFDQAASGMPTAWPAAFVYPLAAKPAPNIMLGEVQQTVSESFGVALVVQNVEDARGDAAIDRLRQLREEVIAALLGTQPTGGCGVITYAAGRYLTSFNGFFWWQDDFACDSYLRSV